MASKKSRKDKGKNEDLQPPKFEGFHSLAGGLQGFKARLDADLRTQSEQRATSPAERAPPRPAAPPHREAVRAPASALDDDLTFHRMMSGVTPLDGGAKARLSRTSDSNHDGLGSKAAEVKARAVVEAEKALDHLHSLVEDVARFEVSDDGKRVEGRRVDVPPDLVRSLRRGLLPIDGRLDLHGMTVTQAKEALLAFLRLMRGRNERCVLVIHGKGERFPGGGVLRGEISAWLAQGRAREHVAAFATARDDDGGEGAVYIALRR